MGILSFDLTLFDLARDDGGVVTKLRAAGDDVHRPHVFGRTTGGSQYLE